MNNLVKVDLRKKNSIRSFGNTKDKDIDVNYFIEVVGRGDEQRIEILNDYINKFSVFALDMETLELSAGYTFDEKSFVNEEYYTKYEDVKVVDLSENMLYLEFEYVCIWGEHRLWGKIKQVLGNGYMINWEAYPKWGSRRAKIIDLLLD